MHKHFLIILSFWMFQGALLKAQTTSIVFQEKNHAEILEAIKKENKTACLYFHFDACVGCKEMEKEVFTIDSVANFYNKNFLNFSVNTREPIGMEVNKVYGVRGQPRFIFLAPNGTMVHKIGSVKPDLFLEHGQKALQPEKGLMHLEKRYANGERDPDMLVKLTHLRYLNYGLDSTVVLEYLSSQSYEALSSKENMEYIYRYCILYGTKPSFGVDHPAFKHMFENKDKYATYYNEDQVIVRIMIIANNSLKQASSQAEFDKVLPYMRPFENRGDIRHADLDGNQRAMIRTDNLILRNQMLWAKEHGDMQQYKEFSDKWVSLMEDDWNKLNNYAWQMYAAYNATKEDVAQGIECVQLSISLDKNYDNLDTYAHLLFKQKKYKKALQVAQEAIDVAEKTDRTYDGTSKLMAQIMDVMK